MSGVATAVVGGAVVGSMIQSNAAKSAAGTEADAADRATAAEQGMFGQEQKNAQPYLDAGYGALEDINKNMASWNQPYTMAQFQQDPGYQFDLNQGEKALQSSAGASGHLISSGELGNASTYAENMASNEFGNAYSRYQQQIQNSYNRLAGVAGMGAQTVGGLNSNATQVAGSIGQNITGAGNASAAGTIGSANAVTGGINQATSGLMNYNLMSSLIPSKGMQTPTAQSSDMSFPQLSQPQMGQSAGYGGGNGSLVSSLAGG